MNTITVTLPWPPAECSPNWRGHWRPRHKASAKAKRDAYYVTIDECQRMCLRRISDWLDENDRFTMQYSFNPPTAHKRDDDNFIARMKPARDGICDALGVDDSVVALLPVEWGEVTPGGEVVITIGLLEDE